MLTTVCSHGTRAVSTGSCKIAAVNTQELAINTQELAVARQLSCSINVVLKRFNTAAHTWVLCAIRPARASKACRCADCAVNLFTCRIVTQYTIQSVWMAGCCTLASCAWLSSFTNVCTHITDLWISCQGSAARVQLGLSQGSPSDLAHIALTNA